MQKTFPAEWLSIIERYVPYYRCLPPAEQSELHGLIHVFLNEKQFERCGGLEISDEIRVTIAAQACMLLLGRKTDFYPTLRSILVYPHVYIAPVTRVDADLLVTEGLESRFGESWSHGYVILSWDDVLKGASDIQDGHNLVFHEFAHHLDEESGAADGVPVLPKHSMFICQGLIHTLDNYFLL